ncbi:MAG: hypothetical protein WBN79_06015 [Gemmatimonadota bacterium]
MRTGNRSRTPRFFSVAKSVTALTIVGLLCTAGEAGAQDSHYWTQQYGPRGSLLSGAVIGSIADISGTFYNPGSLGLAESLPFALSTDVYEYESIRLEDGAGAGVDLGTTRSGVRPSLLAGTITSSLGGGVLAYSALTRTRAASDVNAQIIASGAEVPPQLDLEDVVGVARIDGEFSDFWAGLTYSHTVGSHLGLGLTLYGAHRTQRRRREGIQEAIGTDGSTFVNIDMGGGNYSALRTLAKIGGYFSSGPVSAGLTVTTPSLHITGSGEFGVNEATFSSDTTALLATVQTGLDAEYKSPLSVGLGLGWQIGKARLNASGEWFDKIDPYVVMQGEEFIQQEPEQPVTFDLVQAMDEVFNWALGLEYAFKESVVGYASFATDKTGFTDSIERADLSLGNLDLYSAFLGADFRVKTARLTVGAGYGWGSSPAPRITDVLQGADEGREAKYVYSRFRLLFGFELGVD